MKYERPSFEDRMYEHMNAKPYRPETINYLGHICKVGAVSAETVLNVLTVLEEDRRLTDIEMADGIIEHITQNEDHTVAEYYQPELPNQTKIDAVQAHFIARFRAKWKSLTLMYP